MCNSRIIFAFGSVPKAGGTFTFYRNLRPEFIKLGIDIRCVSVGKEQARLWDAGYSDEGCVLLAASTSNVKKQAMAFAEWCDQESVDIVMGINSEAILSSFPHLPEKIRVMSRCANAFDHGYRITLSGAERLAAMIATTPRLEYDLVNRYAADPDKLHLIPNGINPEPFNVAASRVRGSKELLQLGFLGRLEDNQKGVFHLPKIVRELNRRDINFQLRIAGKGKHRAILEREMAKEVASGQVEFIGAIPAGSVPDFLGSLDIFVFTSHFEGCPNALLEALMAGCVPVSWLIDGITDYIIQDGETGFVLPVGDYEAFAQVVFTLDADRKSLGLMSAAAAKSARDRFTHQRAAKAYAKIIQEVMRLSPPSWKVKPWSEFQGDMNFTHTWRDWIPGQIKSVIRNSFRIM